jgi:hypothetical protein
MGDIGDSLVGNLGKYLGIYEVKDTFVGLTMTMVDMRMISLGDKGKGRETLGLFTSRSYRLESLMVGDVKVGHGTVGWRSLDLIRFVNSFESRFDGFLGSVGCLEDGFMSTVMI